MISLQIRNIELFVKYQCLFKVKRYILPDIY